MQTAYRLLRKHRPMFIAEVFNVLLLNLILKRQTSIQAAICCKLDARFFNKSFPASTYLQVFIFPYDL